MKLFFQTLVLFGLAANIGSSELRIPLWLSPESGGSAARLDVTQLRAWVDGQKSQVLELQQPGEPLIVILVMDTVGDLSRIDAARSAIARHIDSMPAEWRVALLEAQDGLVVAEDPTSDQEILRERLKGLSVSGTPGLLDALTPAASLAQSILAQAHVRVAVLFVTDGSITDYRGDYSATVVNPSDRGDLSRRFRDRVIQERVTMLTASLGSYGAPLFFVHLQERSGELDVAYQNGIRRFAEETAGAAYFVRGLSEVQSSIDQAWSRIASHYSVHLDEPASEGGDFRIRLETEPQQDLVYRETMAPTSSRE